MDYQEKLKDPRWQKKRLEILNRDSFTCKRCDNKEKPLHVHHIFYSKKTDPWEIDNGFLITLCEDCHDEDKKLGCIVGDLELFLNTLWKNGYNLDELVRLAEALHDIGKKGSKSEVTFDVQRTPLDPPENF